MTHGPCCARSVFFPSGPSTQSICAFSFVATAYAVPFQCCMTLRLTFSSDGLQHALLEKCVRSPVGAISYFSSTFFHHLNFVFHHLSFFPARPQLNFSQTRESRFGKLKSSRKVKVVPDSSSCTPESFWLFCLTFRITRVFVPLLKESVSLNFLSLACRATLMVFVVKYKCKAKA